MTFHLHEENKIAFKKLTKADTGRSSSSHQTHIGLSDKALNFIGNEDVVKDAFLVYGESCEYMECNYGMINRYTGKIEAPKIRIGQTDSKSIVRKIRHLVETRSEEDWYIIYFGLNTEELVFWLFESKSQDYQLLKPYFKNKENQILQRKDKEFGEIITILNTKIKTIANSIDADLEIASQIGNTNRHFRSKSLTEANRLFNEIGRNGEELFNEFLKREKHAGHIKDFSWMNKSVESGKPYDFLIKTNKNLYVDVKTTSNTFNQMIFFSRDEIDFITRRNIGNYAVYRLHEINKNQSAKIRICKDCRQKMKKLLSPLHGLDETIKVEKAILQQTRIGITPYDCFNDIQEQSFFFSVES